MPRRFTKLKQLLALIGYAAYGQDKITVGNIIKVIGSRSFGPLLLLIGIILFSPLSGIPGMPTTMGVFLLLVALQLLFGRNYFWLPDWLLKRSMTRTRLNKSLKWLRPVAGFIDRFLEPRLTVF
ncbi:MAG: exopolysaccharide biosynthesis protein, partial [Desulfurivibrionaceae bacterium]